MTETVHYPVAATRGLAPIFQPPATRRAGRLILLAALLGFVSSLQPAGAQCTGSNPWFATHGNDSLTPATCSGKRCEPPEVSTAIYALTAPPCDPTTSTCAMRATVPSHFLANHLNYPDPVQGAYATLELYPAGGGTLIGSCGLPMAEIAADYIDALVYGSVNCSTGVGSRYELRFISCKSASSTCRKTEPVLLDFFAAAGCVDPPRFSCGDSEGSATGACCVGPMGGAPPVGGGFPAGARSPEDAPDLVPYGVAVTIPGSGPKGVEMRYFFGGGGGPGLPENGGFGKQLGQFWNHAYSQRVVPYPDESRVWLIAPSGSFREFTDLGLDNVYATRIPADEYRTLEWLGAGNGWILHGLDGTKTYFRSDGLWDKTVDRNSKTTQGGYSSGRLTGVTYPDGRQIALAYTGGKLTSIQEVPVTGSGDSPRTWTYSWRTGSGPYTYTQNLQTIVLPGGQERWRFVYDSAVPAHLARVFREGIGGSPSRVEAAWEYDASGNLVKAWKGSDSFSTGVERLTWSYVSETSTEVTDDYGKTTTYTFERESGSGKPRVLSIAGECPSCGLDPDSSIEYDNPANPGHPLLPWKITNGASVTTELTYTDFGRVETRTEALASIDERTTTWTYDTNFPALPTSRSGPSVVASCPTGRETSWVYDPTNGNLLERTESGCEIAGGQLQTFAYTTDFDYSTTTGPQPSEVDPPGFDLTGEDVTSFDYDGNRGDQVLVSRTHPLLGTESYGHDGFNRRTTVTDANAVVTTTQYDALDRVTAVTREGATDPADEKTAYFYTALGDLFCVKYPEGNGMLLEYDGAGRLERLTRGTAIAGTPTPPSTCLADAQPRERTVRTFESYGRVATEQTERCSGTGCTWIVDSTAEHTYESRCQVQKITRAPGEAEESTTEYGYDCNARLTSVWDGNHPAPGSPSTVYHYDDLDRLTATVQGWEPSGAACVVDAASPDPDCLVTEYGYDAQDHLTSVVDGEGNETAYLYSDRDLMTSQTSNVSGTTTYEYNEHGELVETLDARAIATVREVDGADRVLSETFGSDPTLTTTYDYGSTPAQFDVGRLVGITRNGETVVYAYDRFGRRTTDGALGLTYDKNGRRTTLTYPGGITATYSFDFADREASLSADLGAGPVSLVSSAKYAAQGPLLELTFGTSPARLEQRTFDLGLRPKTIAVDGSQLAWAYTLDDVGNVTAIAQTVPGSVSRSFGYQDFQYYLISAQGPWPGPLGWTYDRIGNRLTETRSAQTDDFTYLPNSATPSGNSALLDEVLLAGGAGGSRAYAFGPAGHLASLDAGANALDFTFDAAGQLAAVDRTAESFVDFLYDGRGYLDEVASTSPAFLGRRGLEAPTTTVFTDGFESGDVCAWDLAVGWGGTECPQPPVERHLGVVYDSAGTVHALLPELSAADGTYVFYLAGRPVALLSGSFDPVWTFVTTDHLGTPILALDATGATTWLGGFEPFGHDWQTGVASASANGVLLRLPGQWAHSVWEDATLGTEVFYNLHRWYEPQTGRYTRPDPLSKISSNFGQGLLLTRQEPLYAYARANPIVFFDPLGLASVGRALCVTKWIAVGAGVGAGVGGALGATAAGGACTLVAPGVGTVGCGAGGASGGAAGGGAVGGAIGGLFGSLFCSDECEVNSEERRKTHEHCLRLYEICVSNPGRHRFIDGARCDSCFASCKAQGAWPFERCQLNYYPHGM